MNHSQFCTIKKHIQVLAANAPADRFAPISDSLTAFYQAREKRIYALAEYIEGVINGPEFTGDLKTLAPLYVMFRLPLRVRRQLPMQIDTKEFNRLTSVRMAERLHEDGGTWDGIVLKMLDVAEGEREYFLYFLDIIQ